MTYLPVQRRIGYSGHATEAAGSAIEDTAPGQVAQNLSGGKHLHQWAN